MKFAKLFVFTALAASVLGESFMRLNKTREEVYNLPSGNHGSSIPHVTPTSTFKKEDSEPTPTHSFPHPAAFTQHHNTTNTMPLPSHKSSTHSEDVRLNPSSENNHGQKGENMTLLHTPMNANSTWYSTHFEGKNATDTGKNNTREMKREQRTRIKAKDIEEEVTVLSSSDDVSHSESQVK